MASDCESLARELSLLRQQISAITIPSDQHIRQIVEDKLNPKVTEITYKLDAATTVANNAQAKAITFEGVAAQLKRELASIGAVATTANTAATSSLSKAIENARQTELAKGLANQAKSEASTATSKASNAISDAASAAKVAANATNEVGGLRGIVNGIGSRIDGLGRGIIALEAKVGGAIVKAAEAVGISKQALGAYAKLAGRVLELFNVVATIFTLLEQLAVLETLGARIDAVENQVLALGADISRLLGSLVGIKSRLGNLEYKVPLIEDVASKAIVIGNTATSIARNALQAAGIARQAASQAQSTADGAVRNAKTANDNATTANNNATTAFRKAEEAQGIGEQAKRFAGETFNKAGVALTTALTAIALYQTFKGLRGLQGIPGIPGRQGERGLQGVPGIPGRDGVTAIIQLPGTPGAPGRDGRNGFNGLPGRQGERGLQGVPGTPGRNGRDGIDVNPADLASLRGLIISQHAATRANVNTVTTSAVGGVRGFLVAQFAALTALITAFASSTLVNTALNIMTFAATMHNAVMISNDVAMTLGTIIDQVTGFILPKGLNGESISISTVLGKAAKEIIEDSIGAANYAQITEGWAKANRIYQSAVNVHNQLSNMMGVLTAGMEVIGGNVGKIGNALRKGGVLLDDAYGYMNPQPNLQGKFFNFLQGASAQASTIAAVITIPIAIKEATIGINDSVAELRKNLTQEDPKDAQGNPIKDSLGNNLRHEPGLTVPDPTKTADAGEQAKADSKNLIEATLEDIFDGDD
jgi:hypothetical protein